MARYFIIVHDQHDCPPDIEGTDLADIGAVKSHAMKAARSLICDDVQHGILDLRGLIEVRDAAGNTVFRLPFAQAVTQVSG